MSLISEQNPLGLDGVEFVEYTGGANIHENNLVSGGPAWYQDLFEKWGMKLVSSSPFFGGNQDIQLYRQGDINFIVNCVPSTFANHFAKMHGNSICSTGFRVEDSQQAFKEALKRGARPVQPGGHQIFPFPAIYGIGDSIIYFIDKNHAHTLYEKIFHINKQDQVPFGVGFQIVDHFTNNVPVGEMQKWCDFYTKIFNFKETRYFNIKGKQTGLKSKVMRSPCGKFAVPINEPSDGKSQIQEYLDEYKGSGIQHLALLTPNIVETLQKLKSSNLEFLTPPPNSYYKMLHERLPNVKEDVQILEGNAILVDGDHDGYLLQIFSKNIIGPIFFEVIQRKNHFGFGEGNFQALFDAIERDQKERGYL